MYTWCCAHVSLLGCHGLPSHHMCWVMEKLRNSTQDALRSFTKHYSESLNLSPLLLARTNSLSPQQHFVRLQEAFLVGLLVTIADSVFLSTLKLLTSAHTVFSNVFQTSSSVHSHETRIYFTVSWWIFNIICLVLYVLTSLIPQLYFVTVALSIVS